MPRIRTIKPEFFRHEELQDLEAAHPGQHVMLVFAALWCHCDKRGCFPWRPRTLKLDILPFLDFDLGASLMLLREHGLIKHYVSGGQEFGFVPTFAVHQRISGREAQEDGKFPDHNNNFTDASDGSAAEALGKQRGSQEGKGRERKGKEEGATAPAKAYAFEGKVIRVTQDTIDEWRREYSSLSQSDVLAELRTADAYYLDHPPKNGKWFFQASAWLKREHDKRMREKARGSPAEQRAAMEREVAERARRGML